LVLSFEPIRSQTRIQEQPMTKDSGKSRPAPTPEKKTGQRTAEEVKELDVQQLEERIAPTRI
jgi:hypothetical protein